MEFTPYNDRKASTLTVEDRLQIMDLVALHSNLADQRDVEKFLTLYTPAGQISGGFGTGRGTEAMRRDLPGIFAQDGPLKRHLALNLEITGHGDAAEIFYVLLVVEAEVSTAVTATCGIHDTLRKIDGRWLVEDHRINIDPSMEKAVAAATKAH